MRLEEKMNNMTATNFEIHLYNLKFELLLKHLFDGDIRKKFYDFDNRYEKFQRRIKIKNKIKNF